MVYNINSVALNTIDEYKNLKLGDKNVQTPYYINSIRKKDLRAMIGKGTPDEIVIEARIWEKLKGKNFNKMSEDDIKLFLIERGLGIDCSGFIVHVLNAWYKSKHSNSIWSKFKTNNSLRSRLRYFLRPAENLGAETITNELNCSKVNLKDVMVGDLIRSKSPKLKANHIMIITKVEKDDKDQLISIEYTHSSPYFGVNNGVKNGLIKIVNEDKGLEDQEWLELDNNNECPTKAGFLFGLEDNGIRRLKFYKQLY